MTSMIRVVTFRAWSSNTAQDMTGQTASNHSRNFLAAAAPPMIRSSCCRGRSVRPAKLDAVFIKGRKLASVTPGKRRNTSTAVVLTTASAAPSGAPSPSNGTPANSLSLLPNVRQAQHKKKTAVGPTAWHYRPLVEVTRQSSAEAVGWWTSSTISNALDTAAEFTDHACLRQSDMQHRVEGVSTVYGLDARMRYAVCSPTAAAETGSGSSWLVFRARKMSAVAWRERDQMILKRGKCSVNRHSLLIKLCCYTKTKKIAYHVFDAQSPDFTLHLRRKYYRGQCITERGKHVEHISLRKITCMHGCWSQGPLAWSACSV